MFICTVRLPRRRMLLAAAGLLCLCAVLLWGTGGNTAAVSASAELRGVRTDADRLALLEELGWAVLPQPVLVEELLIPEEFDASYDDYLALQSSQGFDLTQYRGKKVTRYTYEITHYPTGESGVQISLLVYRNRVIGGEVVSPTADGFLHGLQFPG